MEAIRALRSAQGDTDAPQGDPKLPAGTGTKSVYKNVAWRTEKAL